MYEGIKGKSSHLAILNQILINDYIVLNKENAYNTQYEASNCFDRMSTNIAALALTRLGAPVTIGIQLEKNLFTLLTK